MPWQVSDVDKHRKGLTPAQKKKWVSIANDALAQCIKNGGSDKTCAPKAIRIANSKFSEGEEVEMKKVPKVALAFSDPDAAITFKDEGKNADILAYSGKVIKNHFYWGDLVIDVNGMKVEGNKFPLLEDHRTDRKIGFTSKPLTDMNNLRHENATFVDTPYSQEFKTLSDQGFPFQASIYGRPTRVEELGEGTSAEVNGFTFRGPGSIWREWQYKETSITVFGADNKTHAKAFEDDAEEFDVEVFKMGEASAEGGEQIKTETKEVKKKMDLETLKKESPEEYQKLMETAMAVVSAQFSAKETALTERLSAAEAKIQEQDTKILAQEKVEIIRKEKERTAFADSIFDAKLVESTIPKHLHSKVKAQIDHTKFIKEDAFDVEAFTAAVVAEIEDWTKAGVSSSVIGTGFTAKDESSEESRLAAEKVAEDEAWLKQMQGYAGQTVQ